VLQRTSWQALGTSVHVLVEGGDIGPARAAVAEVLEEVDRTYSRFRPDSELSKLNARVGQRTPLSPLLARAIAAALRAARLTDGLVDPTVGRAMRLIGYDVDFPIVARETRPLILRQEPVPGWRALGFDERARSLHLPKGVEIDLGSTGKALAADIAAAKALDASGAQGVLVSLGGDIATAGEAPAGGWQVLVTDDSSAPPDSEGEVIGLGGGAIATSSTTVRRWTRGEIALHHLVDPRTGLPAATPWRTVSVLAATCVDANTAATAVVIGGEARAAWLAKVGLAGRLVRENGSIMRVAGWPLPAAA
jgi:thiamine biosynthesis lipoprotein ApbE